MTLDMIYMLLVDSSRLRGNRPLSIDPESVPTSKDGRAKGRAEDGTVFYAKVGGKSQVQLIRERAEQTRQAELKSQQERRAREREERSKRRRRGT